MSTVIIEPGLQKELIRQIGTSKEKAIKGNLLAQRLGFKDTRSVRLAIVELRHQGIPIIGCSRGYFLATSVNDIQEARRFLRSYIINLCIDLRDLKRIEQFYAGQLKF